MGTAVRRAAKLGMVVLAVMVAGLPRVAAGQVGEITEEPGASDGGIFRATAPVEDASLSAQAEASGFYLWTVWSGLDSPIATEFAPDGRAFIAEKSGVIKAYDSTADQTPVIVADLSANIHDFWDRGLLGLAVDPQFPTNPYIYTLYTLDVGNSWNDLCPTPPGPTDSGCVVDGRLSRLTIDPATNLQVGPELVLIDNRWCSQYPSHSVGDLAFDATGALIVSAGDGASFTFVDYGQGGGTGGTPVNPCNDPDPTQPGGVPTPPDAEGGALRSQDVLTMADSLSYDGAVLRVDPATGNALPNNPLYGGATTEDDRLIAHGLRNPFRITARPNTTELWIGDVGWSGWEEVNRIVDPTDAVVENFGWPCFEGDGHHAGYDAADLDLCEGLYSGAITSSITQPYFPYAHGPAPDPNGCPGAGASVTGLEFGQSTAYPAQYQDALFVGDYAYGCVWAIIADGAGDPDPSQLSTFVSDVGVVDLTSAPNGDLMITDLDAGEIIRVATTPQVSCAADTETVEAESGTLLGTFETGLDAAASGGAYVHAPSGSSGTFDPSNGVTFCFDVATAGTFQIAAKVHAADGGSNSFFVQVDDGPVWLWDLAHDTTYAEQLVGHRGFGVVETTLDAGEHTIGVYLREKRTRIDTIRLVPPGPSNTPPVATITEPLSSLTWQVGGSIPFAGTGVDAEDGPLGAGSMVWRLLLHHCDAPGDCHVHTVETRPGVDSGTFSAVDHELPSHLEIELTVTDSGGLSHTDSVELQPDVVDINLETVPSGLELTVGGTVTAATPFTHTAIVGGAVDLTAPTPQALGPDGYDFVSWSDGGARSHTITAPATPITLTATYELGDAPSCGGLVQEGENGTTLGTFEVGVDPAASDGGYVHAPEGSGSNYTFSPANGVEFCVTVTDAGDYQIAASVLGADSASDSFFVQIDGGPVWTWDLAPSTDYDVQFVRNRGEGVQTVALSEGEHTVGIYLREDGARLDTLEMIYTGGGPLECAGLVQEAEDGSMLGSFVVGLDPAASNGAYANAPDGSGHGYTFSPDNGVELCFDVTTPGDYQLAGNVYGANLGSDSFFVQVDGGPVWTWDVGVNTTYELRSVTDRGAGVQTVNLTAGVHLVGVYLREAGTRLDTLQLINVG